MNTINDFLDKLKLLKNRIPAIRKQSALQAGFNLSALIKLRVQSKGENSNNTRFAPYTAPYARDRSRQGYQTSIVDFTKTGALMNSIQPVLLSHDFRRTVINIQSRSEKGQKILRGQAKKRGNIITPSKSEVAIIAAEFSFSVSRTINTIL